MKEQPVDANLSLGPPGIAFNGRDAPAAGLLDLPVRTRKPRAQGLTNVIDHGAATRAFCDIVASHADLIDVVKFGWGTSLVTKGLREKVEALRAAGIAYCFGGTLFEKAVWQNRMAAYISFCRTFGCPAVEVSDGTIEMGRNERSTHIGRLKEAGFLVFAEVGHKDAARSLAMPASQWIEAIAQDLAAGADFVILEARESGSSGICRGNGELRLDLLDNVLASGVPIERLVFEAPRKAIQEELVKRIGANVNFGNIPLDGIVGLETLRVGLRFDTFMHFEGKRHAK